MQEKIKMIKLLVIVDFQNDFVSKGGLLSFNERKGDLELINKMNIFLKKNAQQFDYIIITQDTHFNEYYSDTNEAKKYKFPLHCDYKTEGWELAFDTKNLNNKNIYLLCKNTFDCWSTESPMLNENQYKKLLSNDNTRDRILCNESLNQLFSFDSKFEEKNCLGYLDDFYRRHFIYKDRQPEIYICGAASDFCVKCAVDGFIKVSDKVRIIDDLTRGINLQNNDLYNDKKYAGRVKIIQSNWIMYDFQITNTENNITLKK